ncbi:MAG: hypothetical protein M1838_001941, partial [Thelocarpon superellum]
MFASLRGSSVALVTVSLCLTQTFAAPRPIHVLRPRSAPPSCVVQTVPDNNNNGAPLDEYHIVFPDTEGSSGVPCGQGFANDLSQREISFKQFSCLPDNAGNDDVLLVTDSLNQDSNVAQAITDGGFGQVNCDRLDEGAAGGN